MLLWLAVGLASHGGVPGGRKTTTAAVCLCACRHRHAAHAGTENDEISIVDASTIIVDPDQGREGERGASVTMTWKLFSLLYSPHSRPDVPDAGGRSQRAKRESRREGEGGAT